MNRETESLLRQIAICNQLKAKIITLLYDRNDIVSEAWVKTAQLVPCYRAFPKGRLGRIVTETNQKTADIDQCIFKILGEYSEQSEKFREMMEKTEK